MEYLFDNEFVKTCSYEECAKHFENSYELEITLGYAARHDNPPVYVSKIRLHSPRSKQQDTEVSVLFFRELGLIIGCHNFIDCTLTICMLSYIPIPILYQ